MKIITPYLIKFGITITILTIIFRYFLSYGIEINHYTIVLLSSIIYGSLMFISGWIFGRKDGEYLPIFDIGFRFHITTYIIHNLISFLWVGLGFGSEKEELNVPISIAIYWGVFLIIHYVFYLKARKNTIDSLDKENIFE